MICQFERRRKQASHQRNALVIWMMSVATEMPGMQVINL